MAPFVHIETCDGEVHLGSDLLSPSSGTVEALDVKREEIRKSPKVQVLFAFSIVFAARASPIVGNG